MKKLMLFLSVVLIVAISSASVMARDKAITQNQLPAKAQSFIKAHFPNEKISFAKIDKDVLSTSYEVVLTNSIKVEFNKNGEWKDVDCKFAQVPTRIVPAQITNKVKELYPNNTIVKIDKDSRDYEVELNDGTDLKFDLNFNIIEVDI